MPHPSLDQHLQSNRPAAVERLLDFCRIPSVSTDPAYLQGIRAAADWVEGQLTELGLAVARPATEGHPVIVGRTPDHLVADPPPGRSRPVRVLFYGHYDVQPPAPLELWDSPPFEPVLRDTDEGPTVFARGASDDKGQVLAFLEALRAVRAAAPDGRFPCHVTVLIEGEEECNHEALPKVIAREKASLAADVVVVSDTLMWDRDTVAVTYAMRGLCYFDVKLHHAARDLHSGLYGGVAANPAVELVRVLGRLVDDHGRIAVPGFYDDVLPLSDDERVRWSGLGFSDERFLGEIGVQRGHGESGYNLLERRWARPTCDINGLYGGYGGPGAKTVIPSFAGAKVSFRLVADQSPTRIAELFRGWLTGHEVHGCRWEITEHGHADPARMSLDSPYLAAARRAIRSATGTEAALVRDGATIPIVADFKKTLGLDTLLVGLGLTDDAIHAPNERFSVRRLHLGARTHALLLHELAAVAG